MVLYETKGDGVDESDGQHFRQAVHVIEPVIAVHGCDSRNACLPGCGQRENVGFCAVRVHYIIVAFSDDLFYLADVAENIGGFDHSDIDSQCPRVIRKNAGAEADELYFHMARQFPEQIEHMSVCSANITAADYVNYPHTYLHGLTAAFLRQSSYNMQMYCALQCERLFALLLCFAFLYK